MPENLALACVSCSLKKGAKEFAFDTATKKKNQALSSTQGRWNEHFEWLGVLVKGKTATGHATVELLDLNRKLIIAIREEEIFLKRHPFNQ